MHKRNRVRFCSGRQLVQRVSTSETHCYAHADWANLPGNVCQQILSSDVDVFYRGAAVCTAWKRISRSEGVGPAKIHIDGGLNGLHSDPRAANLVMDLALAHRATLQDLCVIFPTAGDPDWEGGKIVHDIAYLSNLTRLTITIPGISDWEVFSYLPSSLQELSLGTLHPDYACSQKACSGLTCFNALTNLSKLRLCFETAGGSDFVVNGDLELPVLDLLEFDRDDITWKEESRNVVLPGFTGTCVPEACLIVCFDKVLLTSEAKSGQRAWIDIPWYCLSNECLHRLAMTLPSCC